MKKNVQRKRQDANTRKGQQEQGIAISTHELLFTASGSTGTRTNDYYEPPSTAMPLAVVSSTPSFAYPCFSHIERSERDEELDRIRALSFPPSRYSEVISLLRSQRELQALRSKYYEVISFLRGELGALVETIHDLILIARELNQHAPHDTVFQLHRTCLNTFHRMEKIYFDLESGLDLMLATVRPWMEGA
jgi:hypothetical protein